jgi:hypothetical protein
MLLVRVLGCERPLQPPGSPGPFNEPGRRTPSDYLAGRSGARGHLCCRIRATAGVPEMRAPIRDIEAASLRYRVETAFHDRQPQRRSRALFEAQPVAQCVCAFVHTPPVKQ